MAVIGDWAAEWPAEVGPVWDAQPNKMPIRPSAVNSKTVIFALKVLMLKLSSRFLKFKLFILYFDFSHDILNFFFDNDFVIADLDHTT